MNTSVTDNQIIDFLKTVSDDSLEDSIVLVCEGLEKLTLKKLDVDGDELSEEQKDRLQELCLDRIYGYFDSYLCEYRWTETQTTSVIAEDLTEDQ